MENAGKLSVDERLLRPRTASGSTDFDTVCAELPVEISLNVEEEIQFVDSLLNKYLDQSSKERQPFQEIKDRVIARQHESRLFLGVIGEFSSGKTTLVNALIRENLLRTDVLQGTTAAATVLCYGDSLHVKIRRKKKSLFGGTIALVIRATRLLLKLIKRRPLKLSRQESLSLVHQATSDEVFAKDIVQVDVLTPSPRLKNGLVVVDTPGANSSNPRHAQVTSNALRDICDAALVVVPAEAAGAESLFAFLQEHASDVLYRCVFVVTKIDLLRRAKDRERVLTNLQARISQQLNIDKPTIFACAPQFMMESLRVAPLDSPHDTSDRQVNESLEQTAIVGNSDAVPLQDESEFTPEEIAHWTQEFVSMENELDTVLRRKRMQAQVDDVAKLAMQLLVRTQGILQARSDGYRQRNEALSRVVIPDIREFINARIEKHCERCEHHLGRIAGTSNRNLNARSGSVSSSVSAAITGAKKRKELREALETTIPAIFRSAQTDLQRQLKKTKKQMSKTAQAELQSFHGEFQKHFQALASLGGVLTGAQPNVKKVASDFSNRAQVVNRSMANELRGADRGRNMTGAGMATGGALIGTVLLPGVGTVVGILLGGLFSTLFGPSLAELKRQCLQTVMPEVEENLKTFQASSASVVESTKQTTLGGLKASIGSYAPRYEKLVQEMKDRDAKEKQQLDQFQKQVEHDLELIESRRTHLETTRVKLRDV